MENQNAIQCTAENTAIDFMIQQQQFMIKQQENVLAMMKRVSELSKSQEQVTSELNALKEQVTSIEQQKATFWQDATTLSSWVREILHFDHMGNPCFRFIFRGKVHNTTIARMSHLLRIQAQEEGAVREQVRSPLLFSSSWLDDNLIVSRL